eukprot:CAMPEP_0184395328 /NCGR_PEP_ID=MMETSP0007-20130409/43786_1 /TAXON_ID=97485 /ORGANISM="Prymnesium parvum, Strain Texoma1" /LENGTH=149 /DNA_ID=CAMNT_0026747425 /DNA_START=533 /DNA_END=983 /DNA_ORIENTATION=+
MWLVEAQRLDVRHLQAVHAFARPAHDAQPRGVRSPVAELWRQSLQLERQLRGALVGARGVEQDLLLEGERLVPNVAWKLECDRGALAVRRGVQESVRGNRHHRDALEGVQPMPWQNGAVEEDEAKQVDRAVHLEDVERRALLLRIALVN